MALEVRPVSGWRELRSFVDFPFALHEGTPWIPPLKLERYIYLNRRLNPFFKHGEAQLFLAHRDGRLVGRISAQIDRAFNAYQANRWGLFGFLEFDDDPEVLDALLAAAEAWLRARGRDRMVGPMDFVMVEECGVLVEGFELEPMIRQPWTPPYYRERLEAAGLVKAIDLFHWDVQISDRDERMLPILPKLAERSRTKYGIRIRKMTRRGLWRDVGEFINVYNAAWCKNWGFVPYSNEERTDLWFLWQLIFDRRWFMVAEDDSGTVAIAISIPDINQLYKKMQGKLLPVGWVHYLRRHRYFDRCRIGFLGVLPEHQHTGVGAALYLEHFAMAAVTPVSHGEAGWILETNTSMNRALEAMGARVVKRCRIYERTFEVGVEPAAPPAHLARYEPENSARDKPEIAD